jgi:hypothetical protein
VSSGLSSQRLSTVAAQLADWFIDIVRLWSAVYFDWSSSPVHREAAVLEVLSRNAKIILEAPVDVHGHLYKPLTLVLAAACRRHGVMPTARHWLAAVRNVLDVRRRAAAAGGQRFALSVGGPASIFKDLFGEALIQAGVTDRPTVLVEKHRQASLGLAVNWGLRFLVAYALEIRPARSQARGAHDLRWIRSLIGSDE